MVAPIIIERHPASAAQAVERDEALLEEVFSGARAAPLLRLWYNQPCLVVPRRYAARPGFARVTQDLRAMGWPVVLRRSGGTTVFQDQGVLNVSLFLRSLCPETSDGTAAAYRALLGLLCEAFTALGVEVSPGRVRGAFCDGDHDLTWQGRKLAGTAQRLRRKGAGRARLIHAVLMVRRPSDAALRAVAALDSALGLDRTVDPARVTSLEEIVGAQRGPGDLIDALVEVFRGAELTRRAG